MLSSCYCSVIHLSQSLDAETGQRNDSKPATQLANNQTRLAKHLGAMPNSERLELTTARQEMTPAPIRMDLWRGVRAFLFTLAIPMSLAFAADVLAGSLPWLTIAAVLICIPLATIVVNRTILGEFDRIVSLVAPEELQERQEDFTDKVPTDWPLVGQPFTEGAQRHHG